MGDVGGGASAPPAGHPRHQPHPTPHHAPNPPRKAHHPRTRNLNAMSASDAQANAAFETLAIHAGQDPDPRPARWSPRSTRSRPTSRTASAACAAATSTAASANPTRDRARGVPGRARGRRARARLRLRPGRRGHPAAHAAACPATTWSSPTTRTAAPTGCSPRWPRRWGLRSTAGRRSATSTRSRPRSARQTKVDLGRDADQPAARTSPTSRRWPRSRTRPARCWSSTTPSPRPTCSSRSPSAPTWSCTRRRSTWAATPTSSAARSSCADADLGERARPSTRTRSARSPARSTPGWCCAASRRSACGWTGTATTPSGSSSSWPATRGRRQVLYPGLADHPGHEVAARQMQRFGGMVSFRRRAAARRRRSTSAGAPRLFTLGESLGGVESLIEHPAG